MTARARAQDVQAIALRFHNPDSDAVRLLAECRAAGSWRRYVLEPRRRLLSLRVLCERGRARPLGVGSGVGLPPLRLGIRARLFSGSFPRELLWAVLSFWRTDRDSRD